MTQVALVTHDIERLTNWWPTSVIRPIGQAITRAIHASPKLQVALFVLLASYFAWTHAPRLFILVPQSNHPEPAAKRALLTLIFLFDRGGGYCSGSPSNEQPRRRIRE